jgi:hypothetical protein
MTDLTAASRVSRKALPTFVLLGGCLLGASISGVLLLLVIDKVRDASDRTS